uniref:PHD finger protein 21B n=1 Tax=Gasterosteus aculeatus aculeatus TaxID=481459 RepID=G3N611_GASAC
MRHKITYYFLIVVVLFDWLEMSGTQLSHNAMQKIHLLLHLCAFQMLGTLTAVPIKVPQVSSLHRLAGQAATMLPQVRPKTQIPDSLPQGPAHQLQPVSLQRAVAVVSPRSQGPAAASPRSQGPAAASPRRQGPAAASPRSQGRTLPTANRRLQPEHQPNTQSDGPFGGSRPPSDSLQQALAGPGKVAFMVALGLVTTEHLEEIQTKRQERKRRSTANPAYSGLFEPERKRLASHYLNSSLFLSPCHNCPRAFHPDCLHPPLKTPPRGPWYCPKCQKKVRGPWLNTRVVVVYLC